MTFALGDIIQFDGIEDDQNWTSWFVVDGFDRCMNYAMGPCFYTINGWHHIEEFMQDKWNLDDGELVTDPSDTLLAALAVYRLTGKVGREGDE
jgi:hypothetical protein